AAEDVGNMIQAGWANEDINQVANLARNLEAESDFQAAIQESLKRLRRVQDGWQALLHCADPAKRERGCDVKVRYLYQTLRAIDLQPAFTKFLVGFAMS